MLRWWLYFFSMLISALISSSSSSVTSITLMAASWPVFTWRPWINKLGHCDSGLQNHSRPAVPCLNCVFCKLREAYNFQTVYMPTSKWILRNWNLSTVKLSMFILLWEFILVWSVCKATQYNSHLVHLSIRPIAHNLNQLKYSCWILWDTKIDTLLPQINPQKTFLFKSYIKAILKPTPEGFLDCCFVFIDLFLMPQWRPLHYFFLARNDFLLLIKCWKKPR